MMYGAQQDEYDFHKAGFDRSILDQFLTLSGFCNIQMSIGFGLFNDTSEKVFRGTPISLNVWA
ncbi:unnamed protein product, partial [Choristocarpus tenellus]